MEQHDVEIGTRRDLVLYRIETSKNDLKSAKVLLSQEEKLEWQRKFVMQAIMMIFILQAEKKQSGKLQLQKNL